MRFDSYHPAINLIYFAAVITFSIMCTHPVYLIISWVSALIYSVALKEKKAWAEDIAVNIIAVLIILWYVSFNHFGTTVLTKNFIGNSVTLESLIKGTEIGMVSAAVMMWLFCFHEIMTRDKIIYLTGRICPGFSLFISILFRTIPAVKNRRTLIDNSRAGIGAGRHQGNLLRRLKNSAGEFSAVITWIGDNYLTASDSMRSRGMGLKGRTAFSIYRFDNRDRGLILYFFFSITAVIMAVMLDQTRILYAPVIIIGRTTLLSVVFYVIYLLFCLMPFILQTAAESRYLKRSSH
jgi:energy-coupling factor transport system permease protein